MPWLYPSVLFADLEHSLAASETIEQAFTKNKNESFRKQRVEGLQHPDFGRQKEDERERHHAVKKLTEKQLSMDILTVLFVFRILAVSSTDAISYSLLVLDLSSEIGMRNWSW